MLVYILKSIACLAILFVFYKIFLEKENMHVFKRFYLLGTLLFSMIIPALVFTEYIVVEPEPLVKASTPVIMQQAEYSNDVVHISQALETDVIDIAPILWGVYFIGLFFFGLKFIRNLFQIYRRIRKNPKQKLSRFTQVLMQEKITPHTFFRYIFLNKKKFEADQIPAEVLLHEQTHASQKHSWDVILVELLHVIFWINPFIYLTKKAIKLNHEFLADQAVLKENIDKTTYQNTLLSYLSPDSEKKYQPLANAINYSSTRLTVFGKTFTFGSAVGQVKKRFTVMKTHTSKKAVLLRSLLLLPLLAVLFLSFSETNLIEVEQEQFIDSDIQTDLELPIVSNIKEELKSINALSVNYTDDEVLLIAETIDVHITKAGVILLKNQVVLIDDAFEVLSRYNSDLSKEEKSKVVSATIHVEDGAPQKTIDRIEEILIAHGTATINIAEWNDSDDLEKIWITIMNGDELWINDQQVQLEELAAELSRISGSRKLKNNLNIQIYSEETLHQNFLNKITQEIDKVGASTIQVSTEEYIMPESDFSEQGIDQNTAKVHLKTNKMTLEKDSENEKLFFKFNKKGQLSLNDKRILKNQIVEKLKNNNYNYIEGHSEVYIYSKNATEEDINGLLELLRTVGIDHVGIVTDTPTEKQIAEYNALAKKYNAMLSKSSSIQIKMKDVERLEYIYGLMSKKQKAAAEPFPDFPEMPPVPDAPKAPYEREEAANIIENIIEEQDPYDNVHTVMHISHNNIILPDVMETPLRPRVIKGEVSDIPPPPKEPNSVKAPKVLKGEVSNIPEPPTPPEPISPLDHVIDMAKKNAIFYLEGKEITSDKAIEIMKKNKDINIDSRSSKGKRPVVKMSTKPIRIN